MPQSDWLLPQPDMSVQVNALRDNEGNLLPDALGALLAMAGDSYIEQVPAFDIDGTPVVPPDRHVLDHLARSCALVDEETELLHPFAATTVYVMFGDRYECDICKTPESARYDSPLLVAAGATNGYLCEACARRVVTALGGDGATYLMAADEVPANIQAKVDARLAELGSDTIFT
ncbi:hypothetical protein [Cellulomonas fimi]|uniref:hypothetical protein n=1 Tax=Cellulomonas fimi TaxID=1708 RepID=UPI002358B774|nr:hypothetical protein [Cellulomonas fimi]